MAEYDEANTLGIGLPRPSVQMSRLAHGARSSFRVNLKKKKRKQRGHASDDAAPDVAINGEKQWEVPRENIDDLKEIGSGQFGKVYVGAVRGLVPREKKTTVAFKALADQSKAATQDFLQEVKIMKAIDGPHNIVRLLGVVTEGKPLMMVMQYCRNGDLKGYLHTCEPTASCPSKLSVRQLMAMGADAAEGMAYLASVNIVHRDLAARNCMVCEDMRVLIGDFGLTRSMYQRDYYRMVGSAPLPIRWMAPESLSDGLFTSASDVFAFGVTLWEMVTFGDTPFEDLGNMEVAEQVTEEDLRLEPPPHCPKEAAALMQDCWEEEPDQRPTFGNIEEALRAMLKSCSDEPVTAATLGRKPRTQQPANEGAQPQDGAAGGMYDFADETVGEGSMYDFATETSAAESLYDEPLPDQPGTALYDMASATAPAAGKGAGRRGSDSGRSPARQTMAELEADIKAWVHSMAAGSDASGTLQEMLRTGGALCQVVNTIRPGSVAKVHKSSLVFKHVENIGLALTAMRAIGVAGSDLFVTSDLLEGNMRPVILGLNALRAAAAK